MFRRQCYFFGLFAPILGVLRNFRHFYSNRRLFTEILVINTCFYCLLFEAEILIVLIFTLFPFLSVRGREFAEGALREAYVVSRVRVGDTSQFVLSFDQICTSKGISCQVDRRQKVWNGLKEGFGLSKLPISAEP